jgi:aryl-alcohol dehydrogenase-like predicted oxidoreductase
MHAWQFCKMLHVAERHGWTRFITMQNHLNLLYREEEREMMDLCVEEGVAVTPWSPLARGRLARPWQDSPTHRSATDQYSKKLYDATAEADRPVVERLTAVAQARGVPQVQVALAWLLQKPAVVAPIVSATRQEQLDTLVGALDLRLTAEEVADLERCYVPHALAGF